MHAIKIHFNPFLDLIVSRVGTAAKKKSMKDKVAQITGEGLTYSQLIFSPLEAAKSTPHCLSIARVETCSSAVCSHHPAVFLNPPSQRQTVELIPVTKVQYKWKGDSHVYYVYGNENKVSADYPATCCCVIL